MFKFIVIAWLITLSVLLIADTLWQRERMDRLEAAITHVVGSQR